MYTIKETLRPWAQWYDQWLDGFYLSGLLQFKGQKQVGGDYISKVFRAKAHEIHSKYENAVVAVQNPTYRGFVFDNVLRLFAFNGVERLITAYQAAPSLQRTGRPNSLSFLATEIMNDGAFRGTLRGLPASFLQTSLVLWPSILLTNKTKGGLVQFLTTYSILDALLYPLDVIKNKAYAHTAVPLNIRDALAETSFLGAYRGFFSKMIFNLPYAGALYTTATGDSYSWAFWLATIALYPFNTLKVMSQVGDRPQAFSQITYRGFRGVVPFALLNIVFCWQLTGLFTPERLQNLKKQVAQESIRKNGY